MKINLLVEFGELIIAVYSENKKNIKHMLFGENEDLTNVRAGDTYSYNCPLQGQGFNSLRRSAIYESKCLETIPLMSLSSA
jgi:hypothetical protein